MISTVLLILAREVFMNAYWEFLLWKRSIMSCYSKLRLPFFFWSMFDYRFKSLH